MLTTTSAERQLAAADDVAGACGALADLLVAHGYHLPSVYLFRGGRLRCYASRGYWQVIDGFAPDVGVIGKVLTTGRPALVTDAGTRDDFIEAIPGLHSEASVPIALDGETAGVLSVESHGVLPDDVLEVLERCAAALSRRIAALGGMPARSPFEQLADHVVALSDVTEVAQAQAQLVAAARALSDMGTALVARRTGGGGLHVVAQAGPLAAGLGALTADDLEDVAGWVAHGTSCYFSGGTASRAHRVFVGAGAGAVLVVPLTTRGTHDGVVIVADARPVQPPPAKVKLLEQLAAHGAATLQSFETVEQLRELAFTDVLTGVGSATAFAAYLQEEGARDTPRALCLVDVDNLKTVNDTQGHAAGDRLLRDVAAGLVAAVGGDGRVFRQGGDEFIVVAPADDDAAAATLGRVLCDAARAGGRATASVGVTVAAPIDRAALAAADAALYEVKRRGRDGVQVAPALAGGGDPLPPSRRGGAWAVPASLVDELHEVVFTTDVAGRWTFLNHGWTELSGVPTAEALGRPLESWVHPADVAACRATMAALLSGDRATVRTRWRWSAASGAVRWCELWARALRTPSGEVFGTAGTLTDVTARREAEEALRAQLRLSTVISQVLERFAGVDADGLDAAIDDALEQLGRYAGVDRSHLVRFAADMATMSNTHEWCADGARSQLARLQDVSTDLIADWLPQLRSGRPVHVPRVADLPIGMAALREMLDEQDIRSIIIVPLVSATRLIGFIGFDVVARERVWTEPQIDLLRLVANALVSVVSRHEATEQLARQALIDPLTGLPNRAALLACVQQALDARTGGMTAVLYLDLDGFGAINDRFGHRIGDDLLRGVAARVSGTLRDSDVFARLGGDRFAIACTDLPGADVAVRMGGRVADAVRETTWTRGTELYATASIGIAVADAAWRGVGDRRDAAVLLRDARAAMRRARAQGRDRREIFDERVRPPGEDGRLELARDLRAAVDGRQLELVFQPVVRLGDHEVVGAEALVRWRHPRRGLLLPGEFLGIAEDTGHMLSLGRWVLLEACHRLAGWRAAGNPDLFVGVNLSSLQLADAGLTDTVAEAIARAALPAGALQLELRESVLADAADGAHPVLASLRDRGVRLALDAFGARVGALSPLRTLAIDRLKLDAALTDQVDRDHHATALVRGVCEVARALEVEVVACGLERADQVRAVAAAGCALAQGHVVGRPMEAAAFERTVTADGPRRR